MKHLLTKEDVVHIEANTTNQLHIARHFSALPSDAVDTLLGQPYEYYDHEAGKYVFGVITKEVVTQALRTPGSKFISTHPDFLSPAAVIETCKRVLERRIQAGEVAWVERAAYWQVELVEVYADTIGTCGVVAVKELSEVERAAVRQEAREEGGPVVQVLRSASPKYTNELAIGLYQRKDTGKMYLTAYPGFIGSPPLPSAEQSEADRKASEAYWAELVFLQ